MGTLRRTCATAPRRGPLPRLLWANLLLLLLQYCRKLDSLGYTFVTDSMGLAAVNLTLGSENCPLCEIMRNDGHWAIEGHSRSPILLSIENLYTTCC